MRRAPPGRCTWLQGPRQKEARRETEGTMKTRKTAHVFPFAFRAAFVCVKRMSFPSDTIAALATPVGTSAIAVVRASGSQTATLVREIFGGASPPRAAQHADYRDAKGALVDDVL